VTYTPRRHARAFFGGVPQLETRMHHSLVLSSPRYVHKEDPVRAMFDRLAVTTGFKMADAEQMFENFMKDTRESGLMSLDRFIRSLKKVGIKERDLCVKLFGIFDLDRKGFVNFEEYIASLCIFLADCPRRRQAEALYRLIQCDNPLGDLTKMELLKFITEWGGGLDMKKLLASIDEIFSKLDPDRSGTVDMQEWLDGMLATDALWKTFNKINPFRKYYGLLGPSKKDLMDDSTARTAASKRL